MIPLVRYIVCLLFFVSLSSQWVSALPFEVKRSHCGTGACCPVKKPPTPQKAYCGQEKPKLNTNCDCNEKDLNQRSRIHHEGTDYKWNENYVVKDTPSVLSFDAVAHASFTALPDPPPELS